MTITDWLIDFIVIAFACGTVEFTAHWLKDRRNKKIEEMLCDACNKPRKLLCTKDKRLWLCRNCAKVYKSTKESV